MSDRDVRRWPELPELVAKQLAMIDAEDNEDEEDADGERIDYVTGEVTTEPVIRPWQLDALGDGEFADAVFGWLDKVVVWMNHAYGWQEEQVIPACWQDHQGFAHDLAALAFGRRDAYQLDTPAFAGRWHGDMEDVYRRLNTTLGPGGHCRRGEHERPARYSTQAAESSIARRRGESVSDV